MPAGLLWCGAAPRVGGTVAGIAAVLAVLTAGALATLSYVGPYALAVALALAAAVAAWVKWPRGSVVLRAVTVLAGASGLVWLLAGGPQMDWGGLRATLGSVLRTTGPTGGAAPAGRPVSARLTNGKWRVVLEQGDVRATFLDGSLIDFTRKGGTDQLGSVRACVALGLAYAPADGPVDLEEPELGSTSETLNALAPRRAAPVRGAQYALIVSGPGPLTAAANPLSALNTHHLTSLRLRLADGGVLALWLPAGNLHLDALRRALATVADVFPRYDVYLVGRGAVAVAGGDGKISYARLATLFGRKDAASDDSWAELSVPTPHPAAQMLADAGFRDPMDLLTGFIGSGEDLKTLTDGARPYSEWRPSRPPAMALDLAEPAQPAAMLALVQFRALGAGRLIGRLQFDGPAQKMVALRGFDAIYADRTMRVLSKLSAGSTERRRDLLQFLQGPLARLDLMAPDRTERDARLADVLAQVGLDRRRHRVAAGRHPARQGHLRGERGAGRHTGRAGREGRGHQAAAARAGAAAGRRPCGPPPGGAAPEHAADVAGGRRAGEHGAEEAGRRGDAAGAWLRLREAGPARRRGGDGPARAEDRAGQFGRGGAAEGDGQGADGGD